MTFSQRWIKSSVVLTIITTLFLPQRAGSIGSSFNLTAIAQAKMPVQEKPLPPGSPSLEEYQLIDQYIQSLDTRFHPDLIRAIAWLESNWDQREDNGRDYGVMQVDTKTMPDNIDNKRLREDIKYNIDVGVQILEDKYRWAVEIKKDTPKNRRRMTRLCRKYGYNFRRLSNLQLAILAYNGVRQNQTYRKCIYAVWDAKPWENLLGMKEELITKETR